MLLVSCLLKSISNTILSIMKQGQYFFHLCCFTGLGKRINSPLLHEDIMPWIETVAEVNECEMGSPRGTQEQGRMCNTNKWHSFLLELCRSFMFLFHPEKNMNNKSGLVQNAGN